MLFAPRLNFAFLRSSLWLPVFAFFSCLICVMVLALHGTPAIAQQQAQVLNARSLTRPAELRARRPKQDEPEEAGSFYMGAYDASTESGFKGRGITYDLTLNINKNVYVEILGDLYATSDFGGGIVARGFGNTDVRVGRTFVSPDKKWSGEVLGGIRLPSGPSVISNGSEDVYGRLSAGYRLTDKFKLTGRWLFERTGGEMPTGVSKHKNAFVAKAAYFSGPWTLAGQITNTRRDGVKDANIATFVVASDVDAGSRKINVAGTIVKGLTSGRRSDYFEIGVSTKF